MAMRHCFYFWLSKINKVHMRMPKQSNPCYNAVPNQQTTEQLLSGCEYPQFILRTLPQINLHFIANLT